MSDERRVVCAAIRADDGNLVLGARHYDSLMHATIRARADGEKFHHRDDEDQGFIDQAGIYLTRFQAWQVAFSAGQVTSGSAQRGLYSEDLY